MTVKRRAPIAKTIAEVPIVEILLKKLLLRFPQKSRRYLLLDGSKSMEADIPKMLLGHLNTR